MSEHLRSFVNGLKKSVSRIVNSEQKLIELPIEIQLENNQRRAANATLNDPKPINVRGCTRNLSKNSLSFVVPFIRIGEHYLVSHGEQKRLKLQFELPNGTVRMTVAAERFEMILLHDSVQQYLIGAKIVQINEGDQERYESFLKTNGKAVQKTDEATVNLAHETKKSALSGFLSLF